VKPSHQLEPGVLETAQSHDDLPRLAQEQAALRRVATLVAKGASPAEVFEAVAAEVASLLGSDFSLVGRYEADATLTHVASYPLELLPQLGPRTILDGDDLASVVQRDGQPSCIDYDNASGAVAALARALGVRCAVGAPIVVDDRIWGVMAAGWALPGKASTEEAERAAEFTELVATALANTENRNEIRRLADEQASLRRVATLVAQDMPPSAIFTAVSEEVAQVFDSGAGVLKFEHGTHVLFVGVANIEISIGTRWEFQEGMTSAEVHRTGRSSRIEEVDWSSVGGPVGEASRRLGTVSTVSSPIVVQGGLWGAMTVSSRSDCLPPDTEERLERFTELIATAIANAESREALARLADEQAALRRVATLVARGDPPEEIFSAVGREVQRMFGLEGGDLDVTTVVRFDSGSEFVLVSSSNTILGLPLWSRWAPNDIYVTTRVRRTGRSARVDVDELLAARDPGAAELRRQGVASQIASPIVVEGHLWGAMNINATRALPSGIEERLEKFTELVATAIANAENRSKLAASRKRLVAASDEARRRIERDLHDGTQQRLVSLALAARAAAEDLPPESGDVREKFSKIASGLSEAAEELQEFSRGIHPAILSDAGLRPALEALAMRSPIPVELVIRTEERFPEPVEVAVYFVASEALANAAKHSRSTRIAVTLRLESETLVLAVRDDGVGGADAGRGSGIVGLRDRVEALGGSLAINSKPGGGTEVSAALPVRDELAQR
jgi:signal transduction histidine kinase